MEIQTLDIISVNIWGILVSLCNLIIIFFIMKKLLFGPVKKILAERRKTVDDIYGDAKRALDEANSDKATYEQKLKNADSEALEIIGNAKTKAKEESEHIISEANERAANTVRRAEENIALEKRRAVNEMKDSISEISVDIAEKLIEREINGDDHKKLIDGFIDGIDGGGDK